MLTLTYFRAYSQRNEYMMIYGNQRSRSFIKLCPIHSDLTFSNFFSSKKKKKKKTRPFECWDENVFKCSGLHDQNGTHSHIMVKTLKKKQKTPLFGTKRLITLKHGIHHCVLKYNQICSNDDTGMTLTMHG